MSSHEALAEELAETAETVEARRMAAASPELCMRPSFLEALLAPSPSHDDFIPQLGLYTEFVLFFSGGKDSIACALRLLELGVPAHKIELHHHLVDGAPGTPHFMDWPVTNAYCAAFAKAFGMRYVTTWRDGGFEREMLRHESQTAPVAVPMQTGEYLVTGGERSSFSTRRRFPQVTANLSQRWCSSSLKIEVGDRYFTTNERFADGQRRLVITGERAEESSSRANYKVFEPHRKDNRGGKQVDRYLDHWRAVHTFTEAQVWALLEKYSVNPHAAYWLGMGRASCMKCIFGHANQWATVRKIDAAGFNQIHQYEREFGVTIHRKLSVVEQADRGTPHPMADTHWAQVAMSTTYDLPIILPASEWKLPPGAFAESGGPT